MKKPEKQKIRKNGQKGKPNSSKAYHKSRQNSSKSKGFDRATHARKTVEIREARRKKALEAVPIEEVAQDLQLKNKEGASCPYCKGEKSLELDNQTNQFHCNCCKKKGNCCHLVQKVRALKYWPAIYYLEDLATKKAATRQSKPISSSTSASCHSRQEPERQDFKERVQKAKESNRIEDVIVREANVEYKRTSGKLICRCPFADHEDKTPSFVVNTDEQLFHCFGCGRGGDMFTFLMDYCGFKFIEALGYVDGGNGNSTNQISTPIPQEIKACSKKPTQLLTRCQDFFHSRLCESEVAKVFLQERGLYNAELVSHFKLGFDDGKINQTLSLDVAESLKGLGMINQKGNSRFYRCLTVGLNDANGNIVSLYGRRINKKNKGSKHQFPCGKVQGILNIAALLASQELIITEGAIDTFSVWVMGFRHVTCVFSASFIPPLLVELIKSEQIKTVYLALDNDHEGEKACQRLCDQLPNIDVRRVVFPDGIKDANELLVQLGREKAQQCFHNLLLKAKPFGKQCSSSPTPPPSSAPIPDTTTQKPGSIPVEIYSEEIKIVINDRHYRVRGLEKNLSFDSLRVNIRVFLLDRFHIDTLELYNARQRASFIKTTSSELGVNSEVIKCDVGRILLKLEELQEQNIRAAMKPKAKQVILTDKEQSEALKLLQAPNLLQQLREDFTRCGLVGEQTNILICFLALVSRKLDDPLAVIIQALSAAGKTALMSMALSFMPEEDVVKFTAMTGQSLFYLGEEDLVHKILAISEEQGAEKASYAIKLLQSEKSLSIASTGKDPKSGRFVTHEYRVRGPVQIILTTTAVEIDEELQNRCLVLTVSEDQEQTKAIHRRQRQQETLVGKLKEQDKKHITKLYQNAGRLLRTLVVVNPYAENLTFLDSKPRTRRDHIKYLTLIRAIALLHQYQRPIKRVKHRGREVEYIEASISDIEVANQLISSVMGHSLDELAPQTRRFLLTLQKMVTKQCEKQDIKQQDYMFTRKTIRDFCGWSDFQVRSHLHRLVELEYVLVRTGNRGSRHVYELLYQGEGDDGSRFMLGLIDVETLKNKQGEHRFDKDVGENGEVEGR